MRSVHEIEFSSLSPEYIMISEASVLLFIEYFCRFKFTSLYMKIKFENFARIHKLPTSLQQHLLLARNHSGN